jgi:Carbohydrate-selective porin, OprB family/S-layer homology domain
MTKLFWNVLKVCPVVFAATFFAANSTLAAEVNQSVTSVAQLSEQANIGQVTSVSQFSDVQPTDWAFQALQSLVERYGCVAGYPNGTYRGNRALTRYEFAAGLNSCLDRVNELIATATADLVSKDDLAILQRLQEEFSDELATLRGRVDKLEARTTKLEANQFSTTTKLTGEAIFNVSEAFGDKRVGGADLDANLAFSDRIRLRLNSSFTGKDQLQIRLQARNTVSNSGVTGTNMTRLSFDGDNGNDVVVDKVNYAFNLTDAVRVKVDASNGEFNDNLNNYNPLFASDAQGSISRYGRFSPIYRQGTGGAGATVTINPKGSPIGAAVGYLAARANESIPGTGLTDGSHAAIAQIGYTAPKKNFGLAFAYAHSYQETPTNSVNLFDSTGSSFANSPFGAVDTVANHYGVQGFIKPSKTVTLAGWAGLSNAEAKSGAVAGANADMFYWAANLGIQDIGGKGNLLGFTFGQPPKVTSNDIVTREDSDTTYHLETLYRMKVNDNISVTPGLLVIFNPEHNNSNDTIYVGTLRTTFSF